VRLPAMIARVQMKKGEAKKLKAGFIYVM
jgi:hypothetical protein